MIKIRSNFVFFQIKKDFKWIYVIKFTFSNFSFNLKFTKILLFKITTLLLDCVMHFTRSLTKLLEMNTCSDDLLHFLILETANLKGAIPI